MEALECYRQIYGQGVMLDNYIIQLSLIFKSILIINFKTRRQLCVKQIKANVRLHRISQRN